MWWECRERFDAHPDILGRPADLRLFNSGQRQCGPEWGADGYDCDEKSRKHKIFGSFGYFWTVFSVFWTVVGPGEVPEAEIGIPTFFWDA